MPQFQMVGPGMPHQFNKGFGRAWSMRSKSNGEVPDIQGRIRQFHMDRGSQGQRSYYEAVIGNNLVLSLAPTVKDNVGCHVAMASLTTWHHSDIVPNLSGGSRSM